LLLATWYGAISLSTNTKPNFGSVARESKRALLARNDFSHGPQHCPRHAGRRSVLAALMASNLRWRNSFIDHELRLSQIRSFSDADETETNVVIILFSFLPPDERL